MFRDFRSQEKGDWSSSGQDQNNLLTQNSILASIPRWFQDKDEAATRFFSRFLEQKYRLIFEYFKMVALWSSAKAVT